MHPFSLPSPLKMEYSEWGSSSSVVERYGTKSWCTELPISGSGSAHVGDRGICGLKPLYLPLHKSCFIAYTLANMICIVTSLPARLTPWYHLCQTWSNMVMWHVSHVTTSCSYLFVYLLTSLKWCLVFFFSHTNSFICDANKYLLKDCIRLPLTILSAAKCIVG